MRTQFLPQGDGKQAPANREFLLPKYFAEPRLTLSPGRITDGNPQDPKLEAAIWDKTLQVSARSGAEECEVQRQEWAQGDGRAREKTSASSSPGVAWLRRWPEVGRQDRSSSRVSSAVLRHCSKLFTKKLRSNLISQINL